MNNFPIIIKKLRESKNITQKELAEMLGMKTYTTITKWESGENFPKGKDIKRLAEIFSVRSDFLLGLEDSENSILSEINRISSQLEEPRQEKVLTFAENELERQTNSSTIDLTEKKEEYETLHVHGLESAGEGEWQYDDVEIEVRVPKNEIPEDYDDLAMVVGDSMRPKLHNGDILFIKFTKQIEIGEIGVFRTSRGNFVKKLQKDYLESLNYDYDDIYFDEHEECENIGVVVGYYRK